TGSVQQVDQIFGYPDSTDLDVAGEPDKGTGRLGKDNGTPQNDECTVYDGFIDRLPKLWRTVGWKLQIERGDLTSQQRSGEYPREE
ncbi:hypothetical protein NL367_28550, partial [Klebsiella pneumoniae]|nr:hypothetical protein [Klebsiella pneumoniae]